MADYMSAHITIGGLLPEHALPELVRAIELDGAGPDFGEMFIDADDIVDFLREDGPRTLVDDQARDGQFENIETVCRELGLAYRRYNEAKYERPEQIVIFTGDGVVQVHTAAQLTPTISLDEVSEFKNLEEVKIHLNWVQTFMPPPLEIVS